MRQAVRASSIKEVEMEAPSETKQVLQSIVAALQPNTGIDERGGQILAGAVTLLGTSLHKRIQKHVSSARPCAFKVNDAPQINVALKQ